MEAFVPYWRYGPYRRRWWPGYYNYYDPYYYNPYVSAPYVTNPIVVQQQQPVQKPKRAANIFNKAIHPIPLGMSSIVCLLMIIILLILFAPRNV